VLFLSNQNMHIIYHTFFGKLGLAEQVVISENHSYVLSQVYKRHPIGKNKACLPCVPCLPASSLHLPAKRLPAQFVVCVPLPALPLPHAPSPGKKTSHQQFQIQATHPRREKNKPPTVPSPNPGNTMLQGLIGTLGKLPVLV
jgi:hypothetical protein